MNLVKISENDKMTLYIDADSITKSGEVFEFTELIDYRYAESVHPDNKSLSSILHSIINCETDEQSILGVRDYSGHMGTGEVLNEGYLKDNTRVIPPESLSYKTLQYLKKLKEH
jgi:hypothetical protein